MGKILSLAKAMALILITTILGGLIAYLLFDVFEHGAPSGEWQPVSVGQERAVQILGMDSMSRSVYYIQTSQGNVYSCYDAECRLTKMPHASRAPFEETRYTPPQPPGDVSDSFIGPGPNAGLCTGQTNYIILKDGSVWVWSKIGCCEIGCLFNLVYPLGGLVLGYFTGIIILIVRRRRRRKAIAAI